MAILHNKFTLSNNYVQNIVGSPRTEFYIPPEEPATNMFIPFYLKETVGIEDVHLLEREESRSVLKKWSGCWEMKLKSEM